MTKGADGNPDLNTRTAFGVNASGPVDLVIGPGGDLYYADLIGGNIRRIIFSTANQPPQAVANATPQSGSTPLTVQFDASASTDPNPGATLFYDWDLDSDGQYDDSTLIDPTYTYTTNGQRIVRLRVTDDDGAIDTDDITISVGNNAPSATILTPSATLTWRVGDTISFSGSGSDPETGTMPASSMQWQVILHHCDDAVQNCHTHFVQQFNQVNHGSFVAQDHEWYSYLEINLTVTDSGGLTDQSSVLIDPRSVLLTFRTNPTGLTLAVGGVSQPSPFTREVIVNSSNSVNAPLNQTLGATNYYWVSWTGGRPASHELVAPTTPTTYTATYNVNQIPVVSMTAPTNGAIFTAPANITMSATASDSDGTISKVDFYRGTTLLGSDSTSPYNFVWTNVAAGSYSLRAKATDNRGAVTTSGSVNITVNPSNPPPTVSITAPSSGATFTAPANITINATAADSNGSVTKVDFYRGTTLLGTDTTSPYSFAWNNVTAGSYSLTAKATDNQGAATTSGAVSITVSPGNIPPTVRITVPANGATFTAPANISITATASDSDGTITKVEFFEGTHKLDKPSKNPPYNTLWKDVPAGTYNLTAKAYDNSGAITTSSIVTIKVNP